MSALVGLGSALRLARLSLAGLAGKRPWLVALAPLLWPGLMALFALGEGAESYEPRAVVAFLLGLPLGVLGLALGVRVVASECEGRTLEVAYTVPGGARRVVLARFFAGAALLFVSSLATAALIFVLLTDVHLSSIVGAWVGGVTFLALGMVSGALTRGSVSGALLVSPLLVLALFLGIQGLPLAPFVDALRVAPLGMPEAALTLGRQRVVYALVIASLVALSASLVERRERMLRD